MIHSDRTYSEVIQTTIRAGEGVKERNKKKYVCEACKGLVKISDKYCQACGAELTDAEKESAVYKQWKTEKEKTKAVILFHVKSKVGDTYEAIDTDADKIAEVLGLTVTKSSYGYNTCGFGAKDFNKNMLILTKKLDKVAIIEGA